MTNEELEKLRAELKAPAAKLTINVENLSYEELLDLQKVLNGPMANVLTKDPTPTKNDKEVSETKSSAETYGHSPSFTSSEKELYGIDEELTVMADSENKSAIFDTVLMCYERGYTREKAEKRSDSVAFGINRYVLRSCLDYFYPANGEEPAFVKNNTPPPYTYGEFLKVTEKEESTKKSIHKPLDFDPTLDFDMPSHAYVHSGLDYSQESMLDDGDSFVYRAEIQSSINEDIFNVVKSYYTSGLTRVEAMAKANAMPHGPLYRPTIDRCVSYFFPESGEPSFVKNNKPIPNTLKELIADESSKDNMNM